MLKIRLMRIGTKQRPYYRVVAVDERAKRTGGYIELLGTYNPLTEPKDIKLNQDRIDYWVKKGAQLSYGFLRIIGKAPQRAPRKPKKEKKTEEPASVPAQPVTEQPTETPAGEETPKTEEKPVEETKPEPESQNESGDSSASPQNDNKELAAEPTTPRNDEEKESEKKDEGSA